MRDKKLTKKKFKWFFSFFSFFSIFLGIDGLFKKKKTNGNINNSNRLIVNETGNFTANYSDPEVIKKIKILMESFEDIPLSEDIKVDLEPRVTKK